MHPRYVLHLISFMAMVLGLAEMACAGVAVLYHDPHVVVWGFGICGLVVFVVALVLMLLTRGDVDLSRRDGFAIVTFSWCVAALVGAVPFWASGVIAHPAGAIFEAVSGFSTTGASVLTDLENVPRAIVLWRALMHFFGGMGVLVLCVAILPFLGVGGMQVFRAEMPGPSKDRLTPRIATTAKLFWAIYVGFVVLEALFLKAGRMSWFDAWCHSFATVATGGFSTRTASVGAYHSVYIEVVITVFMFLSGVNFALHHQALRGRWQAFWQDGEFRFYFGLWLAACGIMTLNLWWQAALPAGAALRAAFFTGTSIMTTTGYATADFNLWPALSKFILLLLMVVGACAGSTSGGIKVVRLFILLKAAWREIRLYLQPQAVVQIKVGRRPVESSVVSNIMSFFMLYLAVFVAASALMCLWAPDMMTAITAVLSTLGNVGPGFNAVGPMVDYSHIPAAGLNVLSVCMLLGRLEIYTVFVMLAPAFWEK